MPRLLSFLIFFAVVLAVFGGIHWYLWVRLVRDTALALPWRRALTAIVVLSALSVPMGMILWRLLPREAARWVATFFFGWMGISFLLFSAVLLTDVVRLLAAGAHWVAELFRGGAATPDAPPDPERRVFLARAAATTAVTAALGGATLGAKNAMGEPRVVEVPVRMARLPRALDGFTIAQISDLHVGPTIREKEVRRVVELTNGLRPDLVAITGDLVDGSVEQLRAATAQLARLEARHGVFFVTGNHEYYSGADAWLEELARYGIRVLRNERVAIGDGGPGGATFDLAGVDDYASERFGNGHGTDLDGALSGRDPDRSLVLLAHQPRTGFVKDAIARGVELQLSGHTHGGQIFPFNYLTQTMFPFLNGLYPVAEDGASGHVYVSPGTGYWGPPMRLGTQAEVGKLVLTSA